VGFAWVIALPFDGFGNIGLNGAGNFRDSTFTSFEAAACFLLAARHLGAAFVVVAWHIEADGEG
jgi:hypothetical protein